MKMLTERYRRLFTALLVSTASLSVQGGDHTWSGGGSNGHWSNPANWSSGGAPVAGEANVHVSMRVHGTNQPVLDVPNLQIRQLLIDSYDGALVSFSATGGARLNLSSAALAIDCFTTFPPSLEITLAGTNDVYIYAPFYVSGRISGSGHLVFSQDPSYSDSLIPVSIGGSVGNTYSGFTEVWPGIELQLNKASGAAIPGDLRLYDYYDYQGWGYVSKYTNYNAVVKLLRDDQLSDATSIKLEGVLNLNGHTDTIGGLILGSDGRVTTGTGTLILNGDAAKGLFAGYDAPGVSSHYRSVIEGNLALGTPGNLATGRVFDIDPGHTIELRANVSGLSIAKLRKQGGGELWLSGANNYAGSTLVNEGTLRVLSNGALGGTASGTTMDTGTTLLLGGNLSIGSESLTLNGGELKAVFGLTSWQGPIILQQDSAVFVDPPSTVLNLSGVISGPAGLTKTGGGRLELAGLASNTYEGDTFVAGGTLRLEKAGFVSAPVAVPGNLSIGHTDVVSCANSNQIQSAAAVTISPSGQLILNGYPTVIESLSGEGQVLLGSGTLTVGGNNSSANYGGAISGAGGKLVKLGTGTLTLSGTNTHTGATTVNAGTLLVNGSQPSSPVNVASGAAIGGTGRVGNINSFSGKVSPGCSVGQLNSQNVLLWSGSSFEIELNGMAATNCDRLDVSGVITANGSLSAKLGFVSPVGAQFVIVNNDGADAVSGTFSGLPEGATFASGGAQFRISYHGGDGNDITLTQLTAITPPQFAGLTPLGNGAMQLNGTSLPNATCAIEANADLNTTNWVTIGTANADAAGLLQFVDPSASNFPQRFYRLMAQ